VSQKTEFTYYLTIPSDTRAAVTHKVSNGGNAFLECGGIPAAGFYKDKEYNIIYLLFDPEDARTFTHIPGFPVMMQNVMRYFVVGGSRKGSFVCGDKVDLPNGQYYIFRQEKRSWEITADNHKLALKDPGIYRKGRVSLFGVNYNNSHSDLQGKKGFQKYGDITTVGSRRSIDLYIWLFAGIVGLLSLLVITER
jgi:hypothetical protein